ncbi:MAG: hypothetical protein WAK56_10850, partial [Candidatus Sulfotelmatobacter sp.]
NGPQCNPAKANHIRSLTQENGAGSKSEVGESAAGVEADSERGENNDLSPCKAQNVGVSPQEDRSVSTGEVGEVESRS